MGFMSHNTNPMSKTITSRYKKPTPVGFLLQCVAKYFATKAPDTAIATDVRLSILPGTIADIKGKYLSQAMFWPNENIIV
jgi:hypothetical protein